MERATSLLDSLNEQEQAHFRNLSLLYPQSPSEGQITLIEGLARNLHHPRLLTLIARSPHWLAYQPVLLALAQNEATPEPLRRDLEVAVSIFELMYAMDCASENERKEMGDMVKGLYDQLDKGLRPVVKHILKQKTKQSTLTSCNTIDILPPAPTEAIDWDALSTPPLLQTALPRPMALSREEQIDRAATTPIEAELREALLQSDTDIRHAALRNPLLSESLLVDLLPKCQQSSLFQEIYQEARWYFREPIREALYNAPHLPSEMGRKIHITSQLITSIAEGSKNKMALHRTVCLLERLAESEYQYFILWAKHHAPAMLRVVKVFYDRLQHKQAMQATGLGAAGEGQWTSLEERVMQAHQSTQPAHMLASLKDPDPTVFTVILENPLLTPNELLHVIPTMENTRVEEIAAHHIWSSHPVIVESLLHSPHLSLPTALRLLNRLDTPKALLNLLRDTRIPHIEVREQALESLCQLYQSMDVQQRILAIRTSGGELIQHLSSEILADEATLALLVEDRQIDPSILWRLARNKQTPRQILGAIATHPTLLTHPPILSELLLNPKTPRESALRVWGLLSESEQAQLLASPHLPMALRMA